MKDYIIKAIEKVIEEQYGSQKIQKIQYLSSGRINSVFRVDLKDCDPDKVVVRLRYFNDPEFRSTFWNRNYVR